MTLNVTNLRATLDSIRTHGPEKFDMRDWLSVHFSNPDDDCSYSLHSASTFDIAQCGAAACLAGHGALAAVQMGAKIETPLNVAKWLGLGPEWREYFRYEEPWAWQGHYFEPLRRGVGHAEAEWSTAIWGLEGLIKEAEEQR